MHKKTSDNRSNWTPERLSSLGLLAAGFIIGASLFALLSRTPYSSSPLFCGGAWGKRPDVPRSVAQLDAIHHYATSTVVPQQSFEEISVSLNVLRPGLPFDFLVFGLGRDSLMWDALNPRGNTIFLEEDPEWMQTALKNASRLHAHQVQYRTQLSEADELLRHYAAESTCWPNNSFLRGNTKCRLALNMLPDEIYNTEWDLIMIDAPRGWFNEAPGRMAAIYSAAVMAKNRKKPGVTHVFLHDVDRRVEKMYAEKFLCQRHLVKAVGRLWHFEIPPSSNVNSEQFC